MADTLNDSLVKVTEELKEANTRSLEASKELGKVTAATKASYGEVGAAVKEAVGIDKLKDMVMNLPGMNIAKAVGNVVMKKRREKQEQMNLAKRLGITRDQLLLQKAEQEVVLAREEESKKLIEAAEKLGFNTDRIARVNEEGNVELNGSLRESNGQFVSKTNASAEAQLNALKDFGASIEKKMPEKPTLAKPGPSGAAMVEDAAEERRISDAQLGEQEKQTSLLQQLVDGGLGGDKEDEKGGFLSKIFDNLGNIGVGFIALKTAIGGFATSVAASTAALAKRGASAVARGAGAVARGAGGVVRGAANVGKGLLRGAAAGAKFIPGIGLAVTAAMGIFDGMSAGIEEYKKSGKLGLAVKEGIAGAASGLTFGLVSQESISAGMDKIGTFFSDGWTSFTDGVSKVAGGIADFAKDPLGTMSEVGTALSTKFTETVTSIKEGAGALNTKFAELTGIDIGAGFTATVGLIKDGASALGTKFTELTGIEIPTDFASLKTGIITGAAALGTKFTELTGIDIGETFTGLKDKVLGVATGLNTKFAEVTGIDIGESLTGVKDSILGLGTKISDGFTGLFGEDGFSVEGVKNAISGIGSAISGKFTELTGIELPSFEDVKTSIAGIGASISGGLAALGVPTFSEVTGKMSALATGLAERVGIELPTFDEAKNAVSGLAAGLGSKISGMWDSVTGLFKNADEKQAEIDKSNALQSAEDSGMFTDDLGYNTLNVDKLEGASMMQLEAMRDGASLDGKSQKALEEVIASRASTEPVETITRKSSDMLDDFNAPGADYSSADIVRAKQQAAAAMGNNTTPLGMGSQSIPATVETASLNASTTASNLTYVPSKLAPLPTGSVSMSQLPSGAIMQAEIVQLNTQRTVDLQEQAMTNRETAAMAPITAMSSQTQQTIINNSTQKPFMLPTPISNPNDGGFNTVNGG